MKKLFLIMLVLLPAALPAHKAYRQDMPAIIGEADIVMTAKIMKTSEKRGACETDYEYILSPGRVLKGTFTGTTISFCYSVHVWDETRGCPSVHYLLPPVPRRITAGQTVIAAFKGTPEAGGTARGTGMFDSGELQAVMRLINN